MLLLNICLDVLLKPAKLDDNLLNFHGHFAAQLTTREFKSELAFMIIAKECVEGIMTLDRKSSSVWEDSQGEDVKNSPEQVFSNVGRQRALLTLRHSRWGWLFQGHASVAVWRLCKHFRGRLFWSCISPPDSPAIEGVEFSRSELNEKQTAYLAWWLQYVLSWLDCMFMRGIHQEDCFYTRPWGETLSLIR